MSDMDPKAVRFSYISDDDSYVIYDDDSAASQDALSPEAVCRMLEKGIAVQAQVEALEGKVGTMATWLTDHDPAHILKPTRAELEAQVEALAEGLAAQLAYASNNTGENSAWRKAALAALPKHWAEREWPIRAALAAEEEKPQ